MTDPTPPKLIECWLNEKDFSTESGFAEITVRQYGSIGRIQRRGEIGNHEYLYTGQKKALNHRGGRPKGYTTDRSKEDMEIPEYRTDKYVKNTAWLAEKCMKEDKSFSRELDRIIGVYREKL